ncbi:unnamed protein product [Urochloa decumbens]|uniref:Uncharacterized protein n=1 Tax=Urochloa decumbens TaxID=240449 RepID=A0ABC8XJH9_9POAL
MAFAGVSFAGDGGRSSTPSASATTTVTDSGYHLLVVDGYSRSKEDTPTGECIESRPFRVGGYRWRIRYFPNGEISDYADYVSLFLLMDEDSVTETVKVQFGFSFVDKAQKQVPSDIRANKVQDFSHKIHSWGLSFMKKEDLEKSAHLKDDSLTVKCDIIVTKDVNTGATNAPFVVVPESDMHQHCISLLQSGEGADVTFEVGDDIFAAHRCVLGARSTVFHAELFGPIKEGTKATVIRIDDIEARVFKILLGFWCHGPFSFIYSDTLPEMEEEKDDVTMWQNMLVVALRYDLWRLRLICQSKLCEHINAGTVASILTLAELHHCRGLKKACLHFLNSPANVQEVIVVGGLDHLTRSCPSVLKELISSLVSPKTDAKTEAASSSAPPLVEVSASNIRWYFSELLKYGNGTDVTFEVSGETIAAHRCVLAARSAVFRAELFGPMKEGTNASAIRIDDMEARVFKLLLSFIYSDLMPNIEEKYDYDDYDDYEEDEECNDVNDAEVMLQHLLVAADRYDVQRLRLMCEEKLCGYISTATVATLLELAERHQCTGLKEACLDFLDFPANLQEVMAAGGLNHLKSSCPSVLIDLIAKLALLKLDK